MAIGPGRRLDADDAAPARRRDSTIEARECGPLAELDARRLHRERVGPDVARRVDAPVGLDEAAAAMADRAPGIGIRAVASAADSQANIEALPALHLDPLPAGALVVLGYREDQVAELPEARIGAERGGLAVVEVDRPAPERDRRRRSALGPDDPGRSRARALTGQPLLEDDDPPEPVRLREVRRPAADRAGPDDDKIGAIGRGHGGVPPGNG